MELYIKQNKTEQQCGRAQILKWAIEGTESKTRRC